MFLLLSLHLNPNPICVRKTMQHFKYERTSSAYPIGTHNDLKRYSWQLMLGSTGHFLARKKRVEQRYMASLLCRKPMSSSPTYTPIYHVRLAPSHIPRSSPPRIHNTKHQLHTTKSINYTQMHIPSINATQCKMPIYP
jgi:hypothetical protein